MKRKADKAVESTLEPLSQQANYQQPWITDGAWITGIAGTLMILAMGYYFGITQAHLHGLSFLDGSLVEEKHAVMLIALGTVAAVMVAVELFRLATFKQYVFIRKDPMLEQGRVVQFFAESLKTYLLLLVLFAFCRWCYHSLNEYGFRPQNSYYAPWFYTLDVLWQLFILAGFPYIALTRAFKHSPADDKKDLATLTQKCLTYLLASIPQLRHLRPEFNIDDKRAARGLAVKFFFAPVMTVFFFDNFSHLQNNIDYMLSNAIPAMQNGSYNYDIFGRDIGNILSNIIFSIDVGLAWCGYVVSSRWLDNTTVSAEPTVMGWLVCLISYPPFRVIGGWFLSGPGEHLYSQIPVDGLVTLFASLMMFSYFLYMLPTIWFGLRFSNLTHRGIIRKGPYAVVRHPAYAAKNMAWWFVGLPSAIYAGYTQGFSTGLLYVAGLILLTTVYYARAITEERHLSFDPNYREYCNHVRYRFIPGVI
jgi:protein-S-isoprenylcysteine O-methyltransferase Ste14